MGARSAVGRLAVPGALAFAFASALALGACHSSPDVAQGCNADHNPLDASLCADFAAQGYAPVEAERVELCTRLSVDMLGVRPTTEWIETACAPRKIYDVVVSLQHTTAYRETQRRRWADRFHYNDLLVDVKSIHDLDALVDRLYRADLGYGQFAEQALSHPGFVGRYIGYGQPDAVADAAFRAFLGRPATAPERNDLAALWRPWISNQVVVEAGAATDAGSSAAGGVPACPPNADGVGCYYGYGAAPMVDPQACAAGVRNCESTLLGDATLSFPANGRTDPIAVEDLTFEDWAALRAPGRLFIEQPMFWEAEVDDVLQRYLGYDLGTQHPEARQALIHFFKGTGGDVTRLERAVLTSWAYRQSATEDPAHPRPPSLQNDPIAWGPTKLMIPESWLRSMGQLTGGNPGDCDWRYPNLPDWYYPGMYYGDGTPQATADLDALLADVKYPKTADGRFDGSFRDTASSMGGCPGTLDYASFTTTTRTTTMGLLTSVSQEESIVKMCLLDPADALVPPRIDRTATDDSSIDAVVAHGLTLAEGRAPSADEVADTARRLRQACPRCAAETVARNLCAGLTGGLDFIFY